MKKILTFIAVCMTLSACVSLQQSHTDWITIGPEFPPHKTPAEIEIFTERGDIQRPYGNIGLLRIKNLSVDRDAVKRGVQQARKIVAEKGGDAMVLGQYNNAEDGIPNPTITLIVYAIKYADNLTPEDQEALHDFEIDGALNRSLSF